MDTSDVTIEILRSIRDEIRTTNERLDATRSELGERLDRLEKRQTDTELRLATELAGVAHAVKDVRDLLRDRLDLRDEVKGLDKRVTALERRAGI